MTPKRSTGRKGKKGKKAKNEEPATIEPKIGTLKTRQLRLIRES